MPECAIATGEPELWEQAGFGLYLHWPFCQSKCPYCDFNSHVVAEIDQMRWARAYMTEIDRVGAQTSGRVLRSVFFGGGTPSLMDPALVDAILRKIRATWPVANDLEVTLEANPTSVEAARFAAYRDAGVSRISVGIQALDDVALKRLGRLHTVAEAARALAIARSTFDRVSFDLIYARQDQTVLQWQAELTLALDMGPDHLSLYQLTIEAGTAFGARHARGLLRGLPDDDRSADMYDLTQEMTEAAGLSGYETSNHARTGQESLHNLIYWRSGDYAGIGPGAHGRLTLAGRRMATQTPREPLAWLQQVEKAGSGEQAREQLSDEDQLAEMLMMGLRLREGVSLGRVRRLRSGHLPPRIKALEDIGMLEVSGDFLRTTPAGRPVLNTILRQLLVD